MIVPGSPRARFFRRGAHLVTSGKGLARCRRREARIIEQIGASDDRAEHLEVLQVAARMLPALEASRAADGTARRR